MRLALALLILGHASWALADGPADNLAAAVRRVPKLGIEVPAEKRKELETQLTALAKTIAAIEQKKDARSLSLLPDVKIYHKAVEDALKYQEFFVEQEIEKAFSILKEGQARAEQLALGQAPWTTATGLVVRGYVSKIDGSLQPYGMVVPESYAPGGGPYRLDIWFHGRGETLSELNFIEDRRRNKGQFTPANTLVLHPYGRYCNANKFAGEIDTLEALESVQSRYRIDEDRIAVRGFSMGGAACWQFAVHYSDRWVAANPGAGFSETPDFLKVFQKETLTPAWYEQRLWRMYDCTDWAVNLSHCPTVAYSGADDIQKQAADIMEQALKKENIDLVHVIGPATKHSYHPESRDTVDRLMTSLASKGRDRLPRKIHFTTYTLRYNRMHWVTIDALGEHWTRARIDAELIDNGVTVKSDNVTEFTLSMPAGYCPFDLTKPVKVTVNGLEMEGPRPLSDRSWKMTVSLKKLGETPKRHGLQGPIDDAFLDAFVFVRPTGKCQSPPVDAWVHAEMDRAIEHWRRHFRGEARVKDDRAISDADIANMNLVLWGDPASNAVLARIADKLPIRWAGEQVTVGDRRFDAQHHAPIMIYPNPLNPARYIVVNSSFTFRDYDYLNNARQVSKLPDWAIIDVRTPPDSRFPGKISDADFFGESWELRPAHK